MLAPPLSLIYEPDINHLYLIRKKLKPTLTKEWVSYLYKLTIV